MLFWLLQLVSYIFYCDERNVCCSSSVDGWIIEGRCKNSLWSVCKVQDHIVVPEFSTLVLYWLLRNWHFLATLSSEIAWSWRWQCKVLNIGVKNDLFAVCVWFIIVRCFLIRLTLTLFLQNTGMKLQDDMMSQWPAWYCQCCHWILCVSQSVVGRCISGKENLRRHTPTFLRLLKTTMSRAVHVVQHAWNTLC